MQKDERIAVIARIWPRRRGEIGRVVGACTDQIELEHIVPREDLPKLRVCLLHREAVYFEEETCPCCGMQSENQALIGGYALAKKGGQP